MKKTTNAGLARQTLEIIRNGMYQVNNIQIDVSERVDFSVKNTITYSPEQLDKLIEKTPTGETFTTELSVENQRTIEAIQQEKSGLKIGVLNFASAKNPGGGFINGASAQEESLARSSSLYATVKDSEMYTFNRSQSTFLYSDYMIYSPEVLFWMNDQGNLLEKPLVADVITAPAPNKNAMLQNNRPDEISRIEATFRIRIEKMLALALEQKIECLILGAWGCGVFRNDPEFVALCFHEMIEGKFKNRFKKIVFAISNRVGKDECFLAFERALLKP